MTDIAWGFFAVFMFVIGYGFGIFISHAAKQSLIPDYKPEPTINDIMKWLAEDKANTEDSSKREDALPQHKEQENK